MFYHQFEVMLTLTFSLCWRFAYLQWKSEIFTGGGIRDPAVWTWKFREKVKIMRRLLSISKRTVAKIKYINLHVDQQKCYLLSRMKNYHSICSICILCVVLMIFRLVLRQTRLKMHEVKWNPVKLYHHILKRLLIETVNGIHFTTHSTYM